MNVNFYGMSIEVSNARDAKEAYRRLTKMLEAAGIKDWDTDGYQIEEDGEYVDRGSTVPLIND